MEEIFDGSTDRVVGNFACIEVIGEKYFGEGYLACAYGRVYDSP